MSNNLNSPKSACVMKELFKMINILIAKKLLLKLIITVRKYQYKW